MDRPGPVTFGCPYSPNCLWVVERLSEEAAATFDVHRAEWHPSYDETTPWTDRGGITMRDSDALDAIAEVLADRPVETADPRVALVRIIEIVKRCRRLT